VRFTHLQDWLDWQTSLHSKNIDLGLQRSSEVWAKLFNGSRFPAFVITVAGTNGKGSSVAMLEAILQAAGYRTGCYTSPHLVSYNERIRLEGKPVPDNVICEAFDRIDKARGETSLSYFEFGTLAALDIFSRTQLDAVILEVGLGGRLDAVNIIDADAALITAIDIDHRDWLGDTRELIGAEKAGILRRNQPAVFSGQNIPDSIVKLANELSVKLDIAGIDYQVIKTDDDCWALQGTQGKRSALPIPAMRGRYQLDNAAGVVNLLLGLRSFLPVGNEAIRRGLLAAQVEGRFQVISDGENPVVIDVAHNAQSMQALAENLQSFVLKGKLHAIIGMLRDKDIAGSLRPLIEQVDAWHIVPTPGERGLSAKEFEQILLELAPSANTQCHETLAEAHTSVLQYLLCDDTLLVCGSFLVVGEFLAGLKDELKRNLV